MNRSRKSHNRTCPWWLLFAFDNPLRKLVHNPEEILKPHVQSDDIVLDVGCGMGYFSLPLARLVGDGGKVLAADLQPQMLNGLRRRAKRAGLMRRIEPHLSRPEDLAVHEPVVFALAFWMMHEVQNPGLLLDQIHQLLIPSGQLLLVEPRIHVNHQDFELTLDTARNIGFKLVGRPPVKLSRSALLAK